MVGNVFLLPTKKVFHISRKSCRQLLREIQFCAQNFCVKSYAHVRYSKKSFGANLKFNRYNV
ncbi:MAG: hypothetical protein DRQ99_26475 [Candidatus Parabeggiatoa sp. nov. 3]|nr:MAG: hypothetical protein DRQ99_26475 [Gammaproteobacteria bacterium]